ncbi:hypothetical protein COV15_03050 [Candidatus Woesearchaeota archaeon CG10_big_fil_rev_8_21_14_0_10_34_12]|nr:MAG: hypothetical protein COV15_03050 [Candidatus Woesearchaeota archaeon CG10_big_fil_rev_8_21_14_0_10_34_12]
MKADRIVMFVIIAVYLIGLIGIASAITISDVSKNPSEVDPGKTINLNIELKNNLDDSAENVGISLDLSRVPFSPKVSSESFIDEIRKGKTEDIEFNLMANADAESGSYNIPVTISYKIGGVESERTAVISVVINAAPEIVLTSETNLILGQENQIEIKITNTGLASAKFLIVKLGGSTAYRLLSPDSVYIGDLASDDFDSASFSTLVNANPISVQVTVTYKDMLNNDHTKALDVPVNAYSREQAISFGLIKKSNFAVYAGMIVAIVLVIIVYRSIRKKRKNSRR